MIALHIILNERNYISISTAMKEYLGPEDNPSVILNPYKVTKGRKERQN
jgi:hypothetical protein